MLCLSWICQFAHLLLVWCGTAAAAHAETNDLPFSRHRSELGSRCCRLYMSINQIEKLTSSINIFIGVRLRRYPSLREDWPVGVAAISGCYPPRETQIRNTWAKKN